MSKHIHLEDLAPTYVITLSHNEKGWKANLSFTSRVTSKGDLYSKSRCLYDIPLFQKPSHAFDYLLKDIEDEVNRFMGSK